MKNKNPFVGWTIQEIKHAEATLYTIQVGYEIFSKDGEMSFPKDEAEEHFETVYHALDHMLKNGTFEEREDARDAVKNLRMMPLRFH